MIPSGREEILVEKLQEGDIGTGEQKKRITWLRDIYVKRWKIDEKCDRKMHIKCLCSDLQLAVCMQRGTVGKEKRNT